MQMTARVREIIERNVSDYYIPLVVAGGDAVHIFPVYFARIVGRNLLTIPATDATGIDEALKKTTPASAVVADRMAGFEAYLLEGTARYVTDKLDYQLVASMQNEVPGFPVHGAVVFYIEKVHLMPPP